MTIFEAVKAEVTPRMAAERYGLRVSRSGMVRCLFHDDASKTAELENLLGKYIPAAEAMRTKLKKYDGLYRQLTEEKAALEKKLASASGESIRKKLEINQKLRELEELRHTVEILPPEILQAVKRHNPYKGQER